MRKSTIGVLVGLLSVGCGDPSDDPRDDAPESEQAERGSGFYSVTFAVKANPESLGSASVSIFNALGETCAGASCKAYPLNQAYFQATPKSSARFVGWSGCSFVGLGHYSAATFLENVGVLNETCTANFADASSTTSDTPEPSDLPVGSDPVFPSEPEVDQPNPDQPDRDDRTRPIPERPGTDFPEEDAPEDVFPGSAEPDQTPPEEIAPGDDEQEAEGDSTSDGREPVEGADDAPRPGKDTPEQTPPPEEGEETGDDAEEEDDGSEVDPLLDPPAAEDDETPRRRPANTNAR